MSALLSDHPLRPQEAPRSRREPPEPGSRASVNCKESRPVRCPVRGPGGYGGPGGRPLLRPSGNRLRGTAGWSQEGPPGLHPPKKTPHCIPPRPGPKPPPEGTADSGPLEAPPTSAPSRGPASRPAPAPPVQRSRPLPHRPRRGLAQQRAHLRGAPSRPPPARSAVPAQAPTSSLRSPGDARALQPAKKRQWRRRPEKGRRQRRRGRCATS